MDGNSELFIIHSVKWLSWIVQLSEYDPTSDLIQCWRAGRFHISMPQLGEFAFEFFF